MSGIADSDWVIIDLKRILLRDGIRDISLVITNTDKSRATSRFEVRIGLIAIVESDSYSYFENNVQIKNIDAFVLNNEYQAKLLCLNTDKAKVANIHLSWRLDIDGVHDTY